MPINADPLSLVVAGVGGQGNVLMARMIGSVLLKNGYLVTMADDIGVAQRAGAVVSNIRFSRRRRYGAMIPEGHAHFVVGLEPLETLRMLSRYGNPGVLALSNVRAVFPAGVLLGRDKYPGLGELREAIDALSEKSWFLDATAIALELGAVVSTNIVMLGALLGTGQLPLSREDFEDEIRATLPPKTHELNLKALELGIGAVQQ
jgi:indolepyruvate ferredoxin oxidoreductase beta subunit